MCAALLRASRSWRRIVISEFELKQIEGLRNELDREFEERTGSVRQARPINEFTASGDLTSACHRNGGFTPRVFKKRAIGQGSQRLAQRWIEGVIVNCISWAA